ncbi:glycoside hydrolase family 3 N-terminal domain-containing protein [Gemmatimonas sp.]|uniref:glycoside hydrolase family 3 N-terminal domain-containing protein n=1 Tax=Gemmatimonas sp. TaxID=1962908 RepID=UPI0037BF8588
MSARCGSDILPPFKSAVLDAGVRSIMSVDNSVVGQPTSQNRPLLTDVLKSEWRFNGFVISDAAATGGSIVLHHTEANTAAAARHRGAHARRSAAVARARGHFSHDSRGHSLVGLRGLYWGNATFTCASRRSTVGMRR